MVNKQIGEFGGLSDSVVERIRAVFRAVPAVEKVVLYGSRAKGNFREGSDVDLALFGQDLAYRELVKIEGQLDDLLLPYTFDLSLFSHIVNQDLIDHIGRVGLEFYEKEGISPVTST